MEPLIPPSFSYSPAWRGRGQERGWGLSIDYQKRPAVTGNMEVSSTVRYVRLRPSETLDYRSTAQGAPARGALPYRRTACWQTWANSELSRIHDCSTVSSSTAVMCFNPTRPVSDRCRLSSGRAETGS
eukprot:766020-Hanusia_phi.AAC.3